MKLNKKKLKKEEERIRLLEGEIEKKIFN